MTLRALRRSLLGILLVGIAGALHAQSYVEFFRAIDVDNARAVTDLLARGFDPNTRDEQGQHPLFLALRAQSDRVTRVLIEHPGTGIDQTNVMGETPLMMAALRGREDWVGMLIERGARINREGWTALHYAASGPSLAVIKQLLDRGGELDARAPNGSTPLMVGAQHGSEDAVMKLLEAGADARLRDARGRSAADLARAAGRVRLAERLDQAPR